MVRGSAVQATGSPSKRRGKDPGIRSWLLHEKDVPEIVGEANLD